jgi:NAD(P)H dehydrogenase (quinone)
MGLDAKTAKLLAAIDASIAAGYLDSSDRTLSEMIGRPTTSLIDAVRSGL